MQPNIAKTGFGWIQVEDKKIRHDIVIRLNGGVEKRKKKLSKAIYGTSHIISLDEIKVVYEGGAAWLLIGSGQQGLVELSDEARAYLEAAGVAVEILPTPQAIQRWNAAEGPGIALFHVTC